MDVLGAIAGVGATLALADGIMGIVEAATATVQQERCSGCNKTFNAPGCLARCIADGGCGGQCHGNIWKNAKPLTLKDADGKEYTINGCYKICENCYDNLVG